jgi:hypothetical protein
VTVDELRNQIKTRPFVPFRVLVADGRSFEVPHEDYISQSPTGRTVIVYHGKVHTVLDALLITGLELEEPQRDSGKIDEIRDLVHRAPFQPFTIHTAGGEPAYVAHPDSIAIAPTGRTIIVYPPDSKSHKFIDVLLISQLDMHGQDAGVS